MAHGLSAYALDHVSDLMKKTPGKDPPLMDKSRPLTDRSTLNMTLGESENLFDGLLGECDGNFYYIDIVSFSILNARYKPKPLAA